MNSATSTELARTIAKVCGPQRLLHLGAADGELVGALLASSCDAHGLVTTAAAAANANAGWPGRFTTDMPAASGAPWHTVVADTWLDACADADVPKALEQLHEIGARFAFLNVATTPDHANPGAVRNRAWWESRCFAAGFRKHPAYYRVNSYVSLEREAGTLRIPLERMPAAAETRWPLAVLERTRQLHMDMLREQGRRGDAHCIRYHMAAQYVRPGDTVLDLACGYGYGSYILWHNSLARSVLGIDLESAAIDYANANYAVPGAVRFANGNAQRLADLADHSIDFIASFETIEHLPDPAAYLDELRRVLRPSGRVMLCAPNDWTDETGKDPNPHHLHVYTWDRLRQEVGARFVLEKGFAQTAGGAMKCHHAPRTWTEIPLAPLAGDAEWILLLAMADPSPAAAIAYEETSWQLPADAGFNFLAFARDYDNPWLAKGMVTLGMRLGDPHALCELQERVLAQAPRDSVDHGAALCGKAYAALNAPALDDVRAAELQVAIRAYADLPPNNPHRLRWQISLLFVGGELARKRGDVALARQRYEDCASRDACAYSPLLGNRTLDALFRLASIALVDGDLPRMRELMQRSVVEARRMVSGSWLNVCGDLARPIPAGLAELAQLLDKASRAAYVLAVTDTALQRPAMFAEQARGWFERILDGKNDELAELRRGRDVMVGDVALLNAQVQQLATEVLAKEARLHELGAEIVRQQQQQLQQQLQQRPPAGWLRRWLRRLGLSNGWT